MIGKVPFETRGGKHLVTRESSRATSHHFFPVLASAACGACPRACRTKGRTDQGYLQLVLRPLALRFIRSAERRGTQVGSANWLHRMRGASGHALLPPAPNLPRRRPAPANTALSGLVFASPELTRTDLACTPEAAQDRRPV